MARPGLIFNTPPSARNNIIRKAAEAGNDVGDAGILQFFERRQAGLETTDGGQRYLGTALYRIAAGRNHAQVIATLEPASLAKYTFTLAQQFNLFYHRYRIVSETDPERRMFYLSVVELVRKVLATRARHDGDADPAADVSAKEMNIANGDA